MMAARCVGEGVGVGSACGSGSGRGEEGKYSLIRDAAFRTCSDFKVRKKRQKVRIMMADFYSPSASLFDLLG